MTQVTGGGGGGGGGGTFLVLANSLFSYLSFIIFFQLSEQTEFPGGNSDSGLFQHQCGGRFVSVCVRSQKFLRIILFSTFFRKMSFLDSQNNLKKNFLEYFIPHYDIFTKFMAYCLKNFNRKVVWFL
jgi:hypothetical protein